MSGMSGMSGVSNTGARLEIPIEFQGQRVQIEEVSNKLFSMMKTMMGELGIEQVKHLKEVMAQNIKTTLNELYDKLVYILLERIKERFVQVDQAMNMTMMQMKLEMDRMKREITQIADEAVTKIQTAEPTKVMEITQNVRNVNHVRVTRLESDIRNTLSGFNDRLLKLEMGK